MSSSAWVAIAAGEAQICRMRAMSCFEVSADLAGAIERVVADSTPLAITLECGKGAVLVSASEWASIEETLYVLRSPANAERLLEAVRGFEAEEEGVAFP
ncbi:type II toxin-antitoxin system Phd/YefM family antitoxin [Sphingomonas aquatilis]|uniref:Antitoxin n=2 Tax=Sphingomonas aquatilis TaxID=93063 RepID=A0AAW3TUF8_9SPHN|nr:type II toxin-antitoxin system prevent-host-death family antitoxin [Sphingomonas aquatilis]MBB3875045.1 antitoxin YefM [Sphingomonas aquatilis]MCI4655393.1 type II toxin-antitoxin system prevent-host-death family antitoxin [Sphingomonas aquatilis]